MSRRDTKLRLNVIHTIDREDLLNGVSGVLCCLSGGADSVTLLDVMLSLRQRYGIMISGYAATKQTAMKCFVKNCAQNMV